VPRIGLISDTHGFLDPQVVDHFAGVDRIVHAGDIGWPSLLLELEAVAPVTAVAGNTDNHPGWDLTEVLEFGGCRILVHHIVEPRRLTDDLRRRIQRVEPHVVVFGHTHTTALERIDGVLYVNPGSAAQGRSGQPRSVAILHGADGAADLAVDFITLGR
jgi:putative phosphoesterase